MPKTKLLKILMAPWAGKNERRRMKKRIQGKEILKHGGCKKG
jgi:hypothetical protein